MTQTVLPDTPSGPKTYAVFSLHKMSTSCIVNNLVPGVRFERDEAHERFISLLRLREINLFDSTMLDPAYFIILTKAWEVEPTSKSSVTSTLSHMPDAIFQTNPGKVDPTRFVAPVSLCYTVYSTVSTVILVGLRGSNPITDSIMS